MPVFFCWHCYGDNPSAAGICRHCGRQIAPPEHTSYVDKLLWALDHPLIERRMVAARVLGTRGEQRAVPALQRLVAQKEDPFLAAEALQSLVRIVGVQALEGELRRLAEAGDAPLRRVARRVLAHSSPGPKEA
jgi:HEAT repeat protein